MPRGHVAGGQVAAPDASEVVEYGSELLVDIEATMRFGNNFRVAVGAENVFDAMTIRCYQPVP